MSVAHDCVREPMNSIGLHLTQTLIQTEANTQDSMLYLYSLTLSRRGEETAKKTVGLRVNASHCSAVA